MSILADYQTLVNRLTTLNAASNYGATAKAWAISSSLIIWSSVGMSEASIV